MYHWELVAVIYCITTIFFFFLPFLTRYNDLHVESLLAWGNHTRRIIPLEYHGTRNPIGDHGQRVHPSKCVRIHGDVSAVSRLSRAIYRLT